MTDAHREDLAAELERRFTTDTSRVVLGDRKLSLLRPKSFDDLLSEEDFARDDRLPYWADLWPSSQVLARRVLGERGDGQTILELGCGLGLVTVAAMLAGFDVTATDYYEDALRFTRLNALRAVGREPRTRLLDWRHLPEDLGTFSHVVAADVLYERTYGALMAEVIARSLSDGGRALIADPGRIAVDSFLVECAGRNLEVVEAVVHPYEEGEAIRQRVTIFELRRKLTR
jgi:predicted nicotinamide N-methyase